MDWLLYISVWFGGILLGWVICRTNRATKEEKTYEQAVRLLLVLHAKHWPATNLPVAGQTISEVLNQIDHLTAAMMRRDKPDDDISEEEHRARMRRMREWISNPNIAITPKEPPRDTLDAPAMVAGTRFMIGIAHKMVIDAAKRNYIWEAAPELLTDDQRALRKKWPPLDNMVERINAYVREHPGVFGSDAIDNATDVAAEIDEAYNAVRKRFMTLVER